MSAPCEKGGKGGKEKKGGKLAGEGGEGEEISGYLERKGLIFQKKGG